MVDNSNLTQTGSCVTLGNYYIRIYVLEEFNDKMDELIGTPDHARNIPEVVAGALTKLGVSNPSVEWADD